MLSGGGGARRSRGASRRSRGVSHPSWVHVCVRACVRIESVRGRMHSLRAYVCARARACACASDTRACAYNEHDDAVQ
jgi:hypothetical protein